MDPMNYTPVENDQPWSDAKIAEWLGGVSLITVKRKRSQYGMPGPHFRIGQTPYTWRSALLAWVATLSPAHRLDGKPVRRPRGDTGEAA